MGGVSGGKLCMMLLLCCCSRKLLICGLCSEQLLRGLRCALCGCNLLCCLLLGPICGHLCRGRTGRGQGGDRIVSREGLLGVRGADRTQKGTG